MKVGYIELAGKKHPLCFSLKAVELLCERFVSLEKMEQMLLSDNVAVVARATDHTLMALMAAGRSYATAIGEEVPPPLPVGICPGDLIPVGDASAMRAIFEVMGADTKRTVEVEPEGKNGEATQGV